eukprot:tig00020554_g10811.t1
MTTRTRIASDHHIMERRRQESQRDYYINHAKAVFDLSTRAEWEAKSEHVAIAGEVQKRLEQLRFERQVGLDERRRRLAELLAQEEAEYRGEINASVETTEQRRERMRTRALELREKREQERRAFVEEKLHQQWRESCDVLRPYESNQFLLQCVAERDMQLIDKILRNKVVEEENKYFTQQWEQERLKKEARAKKDEDRVKALNEEMKRMLETQLDELNMRRAEEKRLREEDAALQKEKWALEQEAAERRDMQELAARKQRAHNLQAFNLEYRKRRFEEKRKEREQDLALINAVLEREKLEEGREMEKKRQLREEAIAFRKYLEQQMKLEVEGEAEMNRLLQLEQEKAWQKRQAEWAKEEEMRNRLMREVLEERKRQIEERREQIRRRQEEAVLERQLLEAEVQRLSAVEASKEVFAKQGRLDNQAFIVQQIKEHEDERARRREEESRATEAVAAAEAAYQAKLALELQRGAQMISYGRRATRRDWCPDGEKGIGA